MRSTLRVAAEAFGYLAARCWRDDAGGWAVVALRDFFRRAQLAGWIPARLAWLLGDPAVTTRAALAAAGITVHQEHRVWHGPDGAVLKRSLGAPEWARARAAHLAR